MCIFEGGGRRKKNKRGDTHTMLSPMWHGTRTLLEPTSHADCRLRGSKEATTTQAENVGLHCTKKRRQGEEITFLDADLRLTLAGPLRVRSASPRSTVKTEKPPRVSADRRCWARHTQEGCCCHTQMHETVNLSALYEKSLGGKEGKRRGCCVHTGVEV